MIIDEIIKSREEEFALFTAKTIPGFDNEHFIGVRTPRLKAIAREYKDSDEAGRFMASLPHRYFEEDQVHAFLISNIKDSDECIKKICEFLPYVDNWATCDQMNPKCFKKYPDKLLPYIRKWLKSDHTYAVRFGIKMLMDHYLDELYNDEYPKMLIKIRSDEYYINMMLAWYFATALAKRYEDILPIIEGKMLDKWVHNKTIQKSVESYRITDEQKAELRKLKIKK